MQGPLSVIFSSFLVSIINPSRIASEHKAPTPENDKCSVTNEEEVVCLSDKSKNNISSKSYDIISSFFIEERVLNANALYLAKI